VEKAIVEGIKRWRRVTDKKKKKKEEEEEKIGKKKEEEKKEEEEDGGGEDDEVSFLFGDEEDEDDEIILSPEEVNKEMKFVTQICDYRGLKRADVLAETFGKDFANQLSQKYDNFYIVFIYFSLISLFVCVFCFVS
jgi:hypothetical protein